MSLPRLPALDKLPALPALRNRPPEPRIPDPLKEVDDVVDEYGLGKWAEDVAPRGRYYIMLAYRDLGVDGLNPPAFYFGPGMLTVPELIVYGYLIFSGYEANEWSSRGFTVQVNELGGRALGGAVVDFEVHRMSRRIGILVFSIFHALGNPYGGGAATTTNQIQMQRLQASGRFDVIMQVNEQGQLEHGGDAAIDQDLRRIETA